MDITASNFRATLPLVFDAISAADFVAMDGEFSGLRRSTDDQAFSVMDTLEERYSKVAASTKEFGLLQLGLSCFHFDASKRQYDTATFSFYLLKKKTAIYSPNTFTVCSNSLRFLASNKFDFNKLFSDGLPYLNQQEALKSRSRLPDKIIERLGVCTDKPTVQDAFSNLYKLIKKNVMIETQALPSISKTPSDDSREDSPKGERNGTGRGFVIGDDFKPSDLLEVPVAQLHSPADYTPPKHSVKKYYLKEIKRSFWKALRLHVTNQLPNVDAFIDYENFSIVIRVFLNEKDRNTYVYYDEIDNFYDAVGFSHIAVHLLESEKPIVGHNCILDIMHFVDKCLEPLPLSLDTFKELYRANFTLIYDTKLLVFDAPFAAQLDNTVLKSVYEFAVKSCPKMVARRDCKSYSLKHRENAHEHDAGYDAFMTGVAFVGIVRKLDGTRARDKSSVVKSPHLKKFENRTYIMQIGDMHALHLAGDDEVVDRSGIFVVTSSSELRFNLVKTFFPDLASPNILSDFSADNRHFVLPSTDADRKKAPTLLRKAQTLCPSGVSICMYSPKGPHSAESMETAESFSSVTATAFSISSKSKKIPPPLQSNSSHTRMSVEGTNEVEQQCDPLTPRTAQLAKNSTLSAKSPEFTPASAADRSKVSCRNLNVSPQTQPVYRSEESDATELEDLGVVIPHSQIEDEKPSSASVLPKRGEKRKSGQQCEEVQMTEVEEEASRAESSKDGSADWQTVRNRNRFQNWRGGSSSYNTANRFTPCKNTDHQDQDSDGEHSSRRRGKRSRTGDVRPPSRSSGDLTDDVDPHGIVADDNDEGGAPGAGAGVLKRLKSVGTEQFSSLSLESPTGDRVFGAPSGTVGVAGGGAGDSFGDTGAVLPAASSCVSSNPHQEDLEEILQQSVEKQPAKQRRGGRSAAGKKRASHDDSDSDQCFQVPNDW